MEEADPAGLEERDAGLAVVLADGRLHLPLVDEVGVELQGRGRLRGVEGDLRLVLRDDVDAAVVDAVVEEVPGELRVQHWDVVAPDAVAELLHLQGRGGQLGLGAGDVGDAGLPEQVLVVVDDRPADDARQAVELPLVGALRDRVGDELRRRRLVRGRVEPLARVEHLEHALRSEARQVGARLVADVEGVRPGVVRRVRCPLDRPGDFRVHDLDARLVLERLQELRNHVTLVLGERGLRELERDAVVRLRAAREFDTRSRGGRSGQRAGGRQRERGARCLLQKVAPAVCR